MRAVLLTSVLHHRLRGDSAASQSDIFRQPRPGPPRIAAHDTLVVALVRCPFPNPAAAATTMRIATCLLWTGCGSLLVAAGVWSLQSALRRSGGLNYDDLKPIGNVRGEVFDYLTNVWFLDAVVVACVGLFITSTIVFGVLSVLASHEQE
jgi:hypothetical protein